MVGFEINVENPITTSEPNKSKNKIVITSHNRKLLKLFDCKSM